MPAFRFIFSWQEFIFVCLFLIMLRSRNKMITRKDVVSKAFLSPPSLILPHPLKPIISEAAYWRPWPSLPSMFSSLCTQDWLLASLPCFLWLRQDHDPHTNLWAGCLWPGLVAAPAAHIPDQWSFPWHEECQPPSLGGGFLPWFLSIQRHAWGNGKETKG